MKALQILLLSFLSISLFAADLPVKEVKSKVSEVTVFLKSAQVTRKKRVDLSSGKTIVKFINLSPFIDAKSVQVKADGQIMVLSVNHQQNYLDKMQKPQELIELENKMESIVADLEVISVKKQIIAEELAFLQANRDLGGTQEQLTASNLQQASDFYGARLTKLKMSEIELNRKQKDLNREKINLQNQINTLTSKKEYPVGEVLVKVDAKQSGNYALEVSYVVNNAGWFPSYDIRARNINEPVQLIYKANVKQDTKVDWDNVKLKFSSSDPNVSGVAPRLKTYFIDYYTVAPVYSLTSNQVSGRVTDPMGQPLPGVNVLVQGTTIGTVTDQNGRYNITIPNNASNLQFSFIGYNSQTRNIAGSVMNITLREDMQALEEVVVTGYGAQDRSDMLLMKSKSAAPARTEEIRIRGTNSIAVPTEQVENVTTVDFEINTPYTVKSDNKNYLVDMAVYDLPAYYQYFSVPKINKEAYLIAHISNWEKYNLLEGEANIFFEDTYIGKTLLDVRYATDTLEISLGRDKQVNVSREKIADYTSKQFIGSKKEEQRAWNIRIKNNKNQRINMIVLDQVPVSTNEEIEVNLQTVSGGKKTAETGEIKWEFELEPGDNKEFDLKYSVKYPKSRSLVVE